MRKIAPPSVILSERLQFLGSGEAPLGCREQIISILLDDRQDTPSAAALSGASNLYRLHTVPVR